MSYEASGIRCHLSMLHFSQFAAEFLFIWKAGILRQQGRCATTSSVSSHLEGQAPEGGNTVATSPDANGTYAKKPAYSNHPALGTASSPGPGP